MVKSESKGQKVKIKRKATRTSAFLLIFCLLSFAFCLLPSLNCLQSSSQTENASLHRWGAVTLFHGLPSDQVRAVAQDADGVMWFGTDAGLARYDGRRIQSVTSEGLSGPRVRALVVDAGGALWVGADGGAFVRASGSQEFRRIEETRGKSVLAVVSSAQGRALLATADGLVFESRLEADGSLVVREVGERLTVATGKAQALQLTSLALAGETIVVGTHGRGLMSVEPSGEAKEVTGKPRAFFVEAMTRTPSGALFFGAQTSGGDSGVFKVDDGKLTRPLKIGGVATGTVTALASSMRGDLYAGTDGRGVFRFSDSGRLVERFTFAGTAGGLRSDHVNAVFVDREGVVWFGTPRGVCRYDPQGVRVEQLSDETESSFVRSLYRTTSGRLLVGTNRGLFVRDDNNAGSVRDDAAGSWREVEEVAGKTIYSLAEDSRGLLLVGTGAGLYVGLQAEGRRTESPVRLAPEERAAARGKSDERDAGESEKAGEENKTRRDELKRLDELKGSDELKGRDEFKDEAGPGRAETKVETGQSESKVESEQGDAKGGASSPSKKVAEPALSGSVRAIARFGDAVYVGTFGRGLERFGGPGRRELIWPHAGEDERGREVVSLYAEEARGRLWIGTANAGVFYFDGNSVRAEPALAPLGSSTVWGASAAQGWLWLATSRGLYAFREGRGLIEVTQGVDARAVVAVTTGGASSTSKDAGANAKSTGSNTENAGSHTEGVPQAWCATAGVGVLRVMLDEQFGAITSRLDTEQGLPTDNAFAVMQVAEATGDEVVRQENTSRFGGTTLFVGTTRGLVRYEPGTLAPVLSLTRVTASRSLQPEELRGGALRLEYPQTGLALDVAAAASRTFPEQFLYAFTLRDAKGRTIKQKLSRDSQFQAETLPAGGYTITARAFTLDLVPSDPLVFNFEVARAPFPRTTVALSVLLALALVALVWGYVQHRKIVRSGEELREANRQLAAARLQLASEAEAERRRIARDLHDQTLADLRRLLLLTDEMQQQGALSTGTTGGTLTTTATVTDPTRLRAEIESISQEVRRICEDLSPSVLENVGFAAALEWALASACAQLPSARRFTYDFECDENLEERLSLAPGVQMQVYRIVQEAVSNVCRHARAAHVSLSVRLDDAGDFLLTLSDDGGGFDATNKKALKGRGLAGIRARASLIEAETEWKRRDDDGGTMFVLRKKDASKT
jgi:signal transduction histidine kinase/ligand-binding sensor domain-containing protein